MPTNTTDDTASISNQPLIPKQNEPKDYAAAAANLMSTYGFAGHTPKPIAKTSKKTKKADKKKKKEGER